MKKLLVMLGFLFSSFTVSGADMSNGAGHVDLYDRVDLTPFAKLTRFFQEHLQ